MADDVKKHMPRWAKRLLVIASIVGPLTGAVVTMFSAYYDVKDRAGEANAKTKAGYETLAPAVKELQLLLGKTQDVVEVQDKEMIILKADRDDKEKRLIRLEAYVDILSRQRSLPAAPPVVKADKPPVVSKIRKFNPPKAEIPADVTGAQQMQMKR